MKIQRNGIAVSFHYGNSRLLMLVPETKKICFSQAIVPDIKIEYYKGQDNFLQWTLPDLSGDEGGDPTKKCVTLLHTLLHARCRVQMLDSAPTSVGSLVFHSCGFKRPL